MIDDERRRPDERLHAIVGRWEMSGYVIGDPPVPVVGTDVYELLAGGHFLVHHVDVTGGEQSVRAIEVIGEPDPAGGYLARSFDSEGNAEVMHVTIDEDGVVVPATARPFDLVRPTARHGALRSPSMCTRSLHPAKRLARSSA
jgi:hypothetical protein